MISFFKNKKKKKKKKIRVKPPTEAPPWHMSPLHELPTPKKIKTSPRVKTTSACLEVSHLQHETRRDWRHRAIFVHLIQAAVYYTVITARTLTAPGTGNSLQVPHIAV